MRITAQEVARLARLSGIELDEEEHADMAGQLDRILTCMQALEQVQTGAEPIRAGLENVFRPDECAQSAPRSDMLANAAEQDGTYILVPRTVE